MKATTTKMLATAALLAAATTGSAQSMQAEIPFAFQAGETRMQPGSYQVRLRQNSGGIPVLQIYNFDDRKSVTTLPRTVERPTRVADKGSDVVLTFECTEGRCALARLWDGSESLYTFATPKPTAATHAASVILRPDRAE